MIGNHSFWQVNYGTHAFEPALAGDRRVDLAIIGGGFTGLTVAREVLRDQPGARVAVLEAEEVGFGASGRNGGFNMTLFGVEPELTVLRWGEQRARDAQHFMQRAVGYVRNLVASEGIDSDYAHTGMWRVAYSDAQLRRLHKTMDLVSRLSAPGSFSFLEQGEIGQHLSSPHMRGAILEPDTGILDPCKHVRELKRLALTRGAGIFEYTPALEIDRKPGGIAIRCPGGTVTAERLVIATNAWSHRLTGLPKIGSRQRPAWTYQIVTEPLTEAEWQEIGWRGRQSIEDNRQLVHYFRVTACGRVTMGGGDVVSGFGNSMAHDDSEEIWAKLERHLHWLFPVLRGKPISWRWGGPVSVNIDLTPEIGFIGDERIVYLTGCQGHGVSLTQLGGRLIADLVQGRQSDLTDFWIVNRKAIPFPPEPLAYASQRLIAGVLRSVDRLEERTLDRARSTALDRK